MSNIKTISELRDYNKVLKDCKNGAPVFLTKNGYGAFVVIEIEEYERLTAITVEDDKEKR